MTAATVGRDWYDGKVGPLVSVVLIIAFGLFYGLAIFGAYLGLRLKKSN